MSDMKRERKERITSRRGRSLERVESRVWGELSTDLIYSKSARLRRELTLLDV